MSDLESKVDTDIIRDSQELEDVLESLQRTLERQMELLKADKFDEFIQAGDEVSFLLDRFTSGRAPMTWRSFELIRKVHGLHRALGLTLTTKSEEVGRNLQKMRSGKNFLKAYSAGV